MLKVAFCWPGVSGYMGACWRSLSKSSDINLLVLAPQASSKYAFDDEIMDGVQWCKLDDEQFQDSKYLHSKLSKFQPDIIVISGWSNSAYKKLAKSKWKKKAKLLLAMDTPWRGDFQQRLAFLVLRDYFKSFYGVLVPGKRTADYAKRLGFNTKRIYESLYAYNDQDIHFAHLNRKQPWPRKFIFIGRYAIEKGIDTLVKAYGLYREKSKIPWSLTCCGSGDLEGMLSGKPGIDNKGFVQPRDLPDLLQDSGCFIFPSSYEPWGVALSEACGAGLPVLCSRSVGASDDLVIDGKNGFLFDPNNIEQLSELMLKIEKNTEQLSTMGIKSREKAENFTANIWAKQWASNFKKIASQ